MKQRISRGSGLALLSVMTMLAIVPMHAQVIVDGKPVQVHSGPIRGDVTWTNDRHWVLRGAVFIQEGATLTIQAGTRVVGEAGSGGTMIVLRGGRLNAIGTREAPIVFTSDQPPGTRSRGDWGGLIINGYARTNLPGGQGEGEADTGIYGGDNDNDNSGSLRYVRVEFAGTEFSPDNELNGIAFQGVGNGGTYEYLQVHMNKDDGIEMFGGNNDLKYFVLTNIGDDSLDWTFGWRGRAQFGVVSQRGDDADAGIEADGNEFNDQLLPRSNPTIYNMTFCGDPDRNEGAESTRGVLFRRGTAVTFRNFIIQGFKTVGFEVNGSTSLGLVTDGTSQIGAGVIFNNGPTGTSNVHAASAAFLTNGVFQDVRVGVNPGIGDCHNHEAPDWRPTSVATLAGGQMTPIQPPNDGFFDPVTFIGGVGPNPSDDWVSGWTAFPQS